MSSQFSAIHDPMECPAAAPAPQTACPRTGNRWVRIAVGICVMVVGFSQLCRGLVLLTGATNYGTRLKVNQSDLYYTSAVSKEDAQRLRDVLVESKICGDKQISMQITKSGKMLQFRFVVKPGSDKDESQIPTVQAMGAMLSSVVFGGAPLEIHLCDDHFQTLRVVPVAAAK
ncbi:MAG TPA: hypothetical protein VHX68_16785 [Planctomycetaceae bacterium]|nr:hypothetical protein [Planctomycetaceae bacterium]